MAFPYLSVLNVASFLLSLVNSSCFQRRQNFAKKGLSLFQGRGCWENTTYTHYFFLQNKHCIYSLSRAFMDFWSFLSFRSVYILNTCLSGKHISRFFSSPEVDIYIISLRVRESYQNLATYKVNTH